ncbi:MAG: hypothetical protein JXA82_16535 [Sedimentisphaerales bacterium]|nr:hypothetical protein [Sedimentisphaerales bacterium]
MAQNDVDNLASKILSRLDELSQLDQIADSVIQKIGRLSIESNLVLASGSAPSCSTSPPYECTTSPFTTCGFLSPPYGPYPDWDCRNVSSHYSDCDSGSSPTYDCTGTTSSVGCPSLMVHDCTAPPGGNPFKCDATKGFSCNGGVVIDFRCISSLEPAFECTDDFNCAGSHVFDCGYNDEGSFDCKGDVFSCKAGADTVVPCGETDMYNIPGNEPGGGTDVDPGDFHCNHMFKCTAGGDTPFKCEALDDFDCGHVGDATGFLCFTTTNFTECVGPPGTNFDCLVVYGKDPEE